MRRNGGWPFAKDMIVRRFLLGILLCLGSTELFREVAAQQLNASATEATLAPRQINLDAGQATKPLDRFFDLSVGSDFPGTLIRDDSQAQLKTTVDELGFRYIRFHAIFHDVLGTVRVENGKTVYDWSEDRQALR